MVKRILHIGSVDKFTAPLFKLMAQHLDITNHHLLCRVGNFPWPKECEVNLLRKNGLAWLFHFILYAFKADKIIIHGLFDSRVNILFCMQPWLLKKCYWVIWGGDLYTYKLDVRTLLWKITELFRRPVLRNMGNMITYVKGDVELARQWYGAKGNHLECLMYPSNVFTTADLPQVVRTTTTVLVGNSADSGNNHLDIFERLGKFKDKNFKLICPLSYGEKGYAEMIVTEGKRLFGDKFVPLTDFMPFEQYLDLLGRVDIAIFNHNRQQAMGNIITLLGLGKKVYMRRGTTSWDSISRLGIKIFDIDDLSLEQIDNVDITLNNRKVKDYFSTENLVLQLEAIFV